MPNAKYVKRLLLNRGSTSLIFSTLTSLLLLLLHQSAFVVLRHQLLLPNQGGPSLLLFASFLADYLVLPRMFPREKDRLVVCRSNARKAQQLPQPFPVCLKGPIIAVSRYILNHLQSVSISLEQLIEVCGVGLIWSVVSGRLPLRQPLSVANPRIVVFP